MAVSVDTENWLPLGDPTRQTLRHCFYLHWALSSLQYSGY